MRIEVPNTGGDLRLGMYADVVVAGASGTSALRVPRSAVQNVGDRTVVYLANPKEPGKFVEREVRLGQISGEHVEVLSGVQPGDVVVTEGILDLHSRFVVGWALSAVNDRHLTLHALDKALKRRCPDVGLLHHSDQGCTYASEDYQTRLARHGIACSMSRRGNCYDNAVAESFFSTVKSEEGDRFDSYAHAKEALFD